MPRTRPDLYEIADYVGSMLKELIKLSRPLQDAKLMSLLSISADLARDYDAVKPKRSHAKPQAEILPMRLKTDAPAVKPERDACAARSVATGPGTRELHSSFRSK